MAQVKVKEEGSPSAPSSLTLADLMAALSLITGSNFTLPASGSGSAVTASPPVASLPPMQPAAGASQVLCDHCQGTGLIASPEIASLKIASPETVPAETAAAEAVPVISESESATVMGEAPINIAADDLSIRWYVITVGRRVGVFPHWHNVAPHVVSVSGACYARYSSHEAATAAYMRATEGGAVRIVH